MRWLFLFAFLLPACGTFAPLPLDADRKPLAFSSSTHRLPVREDLEYSATWNGIPAGRCRFRFERDEDEYRGDAWAKTTGLVSLIYGVSVDARSVISLPDGRSVIWSYATHGADPDRRVVSRFDPGTGNIVSFVKKGDDLSERRFRAPSARDPLGGLRAIRLTDLAVGESMRLDVFTEWYVYRVDVRAMEKERIREAPGTFSTVRLRLDVRKIVKGVPEKDAHGAACWLTTDAERIPVRVEADTNAGRIGLHLIRRTAGWPRVRSGRGTP